MPEIVTSHCRTCLPIRDQRLRRVADGGSFTLITGILAREPIRTGAVASLVNGAVESFVRAANAYVRSVEGRQTGQVYRVE